MPRYNEKFGYAPQNLAHFVKDLRKVVIPCTCKDHDPEGYVPTADCRHPNLLAPHDHNKRSSPVPTQGQTYEALDLINATIRNFVRPPIAMSHNQKAAGQSWEELYAGHNGLFRRLGWANGAKAIAAGDILPILQIYNHLFFFGSLDIALFKWVGGCPNFLGRGDYKSEGGIIELAATQTDANMMTAADKTSICESRMIERLGTLLHECIHVYLLQFACKTCLRYTVNVMNADHHGRAFMKLASALENVSEPLLGVRLSIARDLDFLGHWPKVSDLPSQHDMAEWNWFAGQ